MTWLNEFSMINKDEAFYLTICGGSEADDTYIRKRCVYHVRLSSCIYGIRKTMTHTSVNGP